MSVLVARVRRFDERVDEATDALRGKPAMDRVFYTASFLADHGKLWLAMAALRWATGIGGYDVARFAALRAAAGEFGQSFLVNILIKSLFRRPRPLLVKGVRPLYLRTPRTSSFPSGHSTASFCAATLLGEGTSWAPWLFALAAVVSFSRIYVRIHHASDVLGGVVVGLTLGVLIIHFVPLPS